MVRKYSRELAAASARPLVLAILAQGDSYGYAIIKRVADLSNGNLEWKEGMLYPLLHRLEGQDLIQSYQGKSDDGRPRKYYRLLPPGASELREERRNFDEVLRLFGQLDSGTPPVRYV